MLFVDFLADFFFQSFFFFASNDKEGAGTEPEPERIMGPIHILKQYLTIFSNVNNLFQFFLFFKIILFCFFVLSLFLLFSFILLILLLPTPPLR